MSGCKNMVSDVMSLYPCGKFDLCDDCEFNKKAGQIVSKETKEQVIECYKNFVLEYKDAIPSKIFNMIVLEYLKQ